MPLFRVPGSLGFATASNPIAEWFWKEVAKVWTDFHRQAVPPCPGPTCPSKSAPSVATAKSASAVQEVDSRSEKSIGTLLPEVQSYARTLVLKSAAAGITIKVLSGLRTYEEQDQLYAQGRTTPGKVVTKAKAGYSNHNFGIAFDIGIFEGGKYLPESPKYKSVGAIGVSIGLTWGGNWKSFQDFPHFELHPGWAGPLTESQMLEQLRQRKAGGKTAFTA